MKKSLCWLGCFVCVVLAFADGYFDRMWGDQISESWGFISWLSHHPKADVGIDLLLAAICLIAALWPAKKSTRD